MEQQAGSCTNLLAVFFLQVSAMMDHTPPRERILGTRLTPASVQSVLVTQAQCVSRDITRLIGLEITNRFTPGRGGGGGGTLI